MARYQLWDGIKKVITPSNEVFTPEQWLAINPAFMEEGAVMVLAAGFKNGGLIDELSDLKRRTEERGAVFQDGLTNEELLAAIEKYEDDLAAVLADLEENSVSAEERIAAALEYQNLINS